MEDNLGNPEETAQEFAERLEAGEVGSKGEEGGGNNGEGFTPPVDTDMYSVVKELGVGDLGEDYFKSEKGEVMDKTAATKKLFNDIISNVKNSAFKDDEFISKYLEEKNKEGFTREAYVKTLVEEQKINDESNDAYLRRKLKEAGNTDENIDEFFSKKIKLEIDELAQKYKEKDKQELTQKIQLEEQKKIGEIVKTVKSQNLGIQEAVTKYTDNIIKTGKFPLKLGETELDEITKGMFGLVEKKIAKTANGPVVYQEIDNILADDEILLDLLPFIEARRLGKLNEYIAKSYKGIKDSEFEKIVDSSNIGNGGSQVQGTNFGKFFK